MPRLNYLQPDSTFICFVISGSAGASPSNFHPLTSIRSLYREAGRVVGELAVRDVDSSLVKDVQDGGRVFGGVV